MAPKTVFWTASEFHGLKTPAEKGLATAKLVIFLALGQGKALRAINEASKKLINQKSE